MMNKKRKIVIVGATSAMAERCARLWVCEEAIDLTLIGRDLDKTERIAQDLQVRSPESRIQVRTVDFTNPDAITDLAKDVATGDSIDTVLIAHGSLPNQFACQEDLNENFQSLLVNGVSPALFAEAFAGHMEKSNMGTLAIIGSVAGDRGRKSNYIYGAAKGLVARYAQGLQHRLANTNVKVVLIKPGPTDTPMTALQKQEGMKLAKVDDVAAMIVNGIARGKPFIYAPGKWALIMMVVRHIPSAVFNRINI